jgi:hypothetical protein
MMTNLPDDTINAAEARFARRVRDYTNPAVVPVDHAAVASKAVGAGAPRRSAAGRFGWLFAGAAVLAGIGAVAILVNTWRGPDVGASPSASVPVAAGVTPCSVDALRASVGSWEGAAGHRIGTVTVTNAGTVACKLSGNVLPSLVDRNGGNLIVGKIATGPVVELAPGAGAQALVQTGNYCGPTAQEPATVALQLGGQGRLLAQPAAGDDSSGVPPCMGEAGPTDDITIQPWSSPQT